MAATEDTMDVSTDVDDPPSTYELGATAMEHADQPLTGGQVRPELDLQTSQAQLSRMMADHDSSTSSSSSPSSVLSSPLTPAFSFGSDSSSSASEPDPYPFVFWAFFDYVPDQALSADHIILTFKAGDLILVHEIQPHGWADGTLLTTGERGWLPKNYCKSYNEGRLMSLLLAVAAVEGSLKVTLDDTEGPLRVQIEYPMKQMIDAVRRLLQECHCLHSDLEPVSSDRAIARLRRRLLRELSAFVGAVRYAKQHVWSATQSEERISAEFDEILWKAYSVVPRAVQFVEYWRQASAMKRAARADAVRGAEDAWLGSMAPQPRPAARDGERQTHEYATRNAPEALANVEDFSLGATSEQGTVGGSPSLSPSSPGSTDPPSSVPEVSPTVYSSSSIEEERRAAPSPARDGRGHPSPSSDDVSAPSDSSPDEPPADDSLRHAGAPPSHISPRISTSHLPDHPDHPVPPPTASDDETVLQRLRASKDAFVGQLAVVIALLGRGTTTMELLLTTQQSVQACDALTSVVKEIWERDFRRSSAVETSRIALHMRLAELVNATTDIVTAADASGVDVGSVEERKKRLEKAAAACVQATTDCVRTSQMLEERKQQEEVLAEVETPSPPAAGEGSDHTPRRSRTRKSGDTASTKASRRSVYKSMPPTPPPPPTSIHSHHHHHRRAVTSPDAPPRHPLLDAHVQSLHPPPIPGDDDAMQLPAWNSSTPRPKSTLLRHPTVARRRSETGLRKRPAKADAGSDLPTLDIKIPHGSFFDMSVTPTHPSPGALSTCPTPREMIGGARQLPEYRGNQPTQQTDEVFTDSAESKPCSARNSGGSAPSHASTRATTPDHTAPSALAAESLSASPNHGEGVFTSTHGSTDHLPVECYTHELILNRQGQLTGGSLPALVEHLTSHRAPPDALFTHSFFLTFRRFTTPLALVRTLIDRFERVGGDHTHGTPARLRVFNAFKQWMEGYWNTESDADALHKITKFANGRLRYTLGIPGKRLLELCAQTRALQESSVGSSPIQLSGHRHLTSPEISSSDQPAPTPILRSSPMGLLKNVKKGGPACHLTDFDPLELARQFTIIQSRVFCAIEPHELMPGEWTRNQDSKTNHVKAMSALSTDLANLVVETILSPAEPKKRAAVLTHWINIASASYKELHNYDALMAVVSSLNSSVIERLKKTWALVPHDVIAKFDHIKTIVDCERNYYLLRNQLQRQVPPSLPFLGVYLTDITFMDCGTSSTRPLEDSVEGQTVINFDKYVRITRLISDLQRFQVPYNLQPVPEMQDWMGAQISLVRANGGSVEEYYRRSLQLEPRGPSRMPPPLKTSPSDGVGGSFGGSSSSGSKDSAREGNGFWTGLGLSLNKERASG
ncbi:MAG: hypothetical protein Q9162_006888 [Coniocarpon cinnabarinum]